MKAKARSAMLHTEVKTTCPICDYRVDVYDSIVDKYECLPEHKEEYEVQCPECSNEFWIEIDEIN